MSETRHTLLERLRLNAHLNASDGDEPQGSPEMSWPELFELSALLTEAADSHQALVDVCRQLDEFQRTYHGYTQDNMPGNEHYSAWLMRIVESARAALQHAEAR
jgi:hypothetical protein